MAANKHRHSPARLQKKIKLAIIVNSAYFNVLSTFYPYFSTFFPPLELLAVLIFCFIKALIPVYNLKNLPGNSPGGQQNQQKNSFPQEFLAGPAKLIFGL